MAAADAITVIITDPLVQRASINPNDAGALQDVWDVTALRKNGTPITVDFTLSELEAFANNKLEQKEDVDSDVRALEHDLIRFVANGDPSDELAAKLSQQLTVNQRISEAAFAITVIKDNS